MFTEPCYGYKIKNMTDIRFYHLQRTPLSQALPALATKALEGRYKILIRTANKKDMMKLDKELWTYQPESFLPHGTQDDPLPEYQPVLLAYKNTARAENSANLLIDLDLSDQSLWQNFERCCLIFEDWNKEIKETARAAWKSLQESKEHSLSYWQQSNTKGWEQKA